MKQYTHNELKLVGERRSQLFINWPEEAIKYADAWRIQVEALENELTKTREALNKMPHSIWCKWSNMRHYGRKSRDYCDCYKKVLWDI